MSGFPLIYAPAVDGCECNLARDVSARHPSIRVTCPPCGQDWLAGQPVDIVEFEPEKPAGAR
jgi:hypothetical protein